MLPRIPAAMVSTLLCLMLTGCSDSVDTAATASSGGAGGATTTSSSSATNSSANSTGTGSGGDAEWTLVPWATPGCVVEYAKKPELAFPVLEWEPCPGGEPGCERIKKNWPFDFDNGIAPPAFKSVLGGWETTLLVQYPDYEARRAVIGPNGNATSAYRYDAANDCLAAVNDISTDGHWVGVQRLGVAEPSRFVFQPRDAPPEQAEVVPTTQLAQFQRGGEELLALQLDFGTGWLIYDRVTKVLHTAPSPFTASSPRLSGGNAVMLRYPDLNKPEAWVFSRASGSFTLLIDRNPGHVVAVHADANDLVWVETPPTPTPGAWPVAGTLMRSPFTTVASEVLPTVVRPMPPLVPGSSSAMGEGHFCVGANETTLYVVRLSDGVLWTVNLPSQDGTYVNDLSYIDATYVFFKSKTQIYRQRLDQLGPGQPAN